MRLADEHSLQLNQLIHDKEFESLRQDRNVEVLVDLAGLFIYNEIHGVRTLCIFIREDYVRD